MCYPFKHKDFVGQNVTASMVVTYIFGFVGNCLAFFPSKVPCFTYKIDSTYWRKKISEKFTWDVWGGK